MHSIQKISRIEPAKVIRVGSKYFYKMPNSFQYIQGTRSGKLIGKELNICTPKHIQGYAKITRKKIKEFQTRADIPKSSKDKLFIRTNALNWESS